MKKFWRWQANSNTPANKLILKTLLVLCLSSSYCHSIFADSQNPQNLSISADKKKISMDFQNVSVRSLLKIIAEHNDFNIVASDAVQGNLTLRLDGVSWDKALNTILQIKGLAKKEVGNVLLIAPKAHMDEQARLALAKKQQIQEMAALRTEVIRINHASAESIKNILESDKKHYEENERLSLLSKRGSVAVDKRTNSLIIKEIPKNITHIKQLVAKIDIPVEQVEIEARIVSVDQGTLDDIGVRWGVQRLSNDYRFSGSIENNNRSTSAELQIDEYLSVNLGATSPNASNIAYQITKLGRDLMLDLELSVLQAESRAEVISSPRLLTTNKRSAYIEQGTEIPYLESSSSGATAVTFKKAVLSLNVIPQITDDNKLVLDLEVTQDRPAATVQAGTGEAVSINTQRISTQVLVDNGETVMLGGIYQNELQKAVDKVPLLGDIPFIRRIFRRDYETFVKRELLIFVTPKIIVQ